MPRYLIRGSAGPEYWQGLIRSPENRREAVSKIIEASGGRLEAFYFAFGEDDFFAIVEMPDNVSAAAISLTVGASGSFKSLSTTVLMTAEEVMEAARKAGTVGYRPPGA